MQQEEERVQAKAKADEEARRLQEEEQREARRLQEEEEEREARRLQEEEAAMLRQKEQAALERAEVIQNMLLEMVRKREEQESMLRK